MILDNLSRAFKTQNWFAVATEFVIVIAGVVIGFQVNAWNEARADARQGRVYLGLIATEIRDQIGVYEALIRNSDIVTQRIETVEAALDNRLLVTEDPDDFLENLYSLRLNINFPIPRASYDALEGSGGIELIESDQLIGDLRQHYWTMQVYKLMFDEQSRVREFHSALAGYISIDQVRTLSPREWGDNSRTEEFDAAAVAELARRISEDEEVRRWLPVIYAQALSLERYASFQKERAEEILEQIQLEIDGQNNLAP